MFQGHNSDPGWGCLLTSTLQSIECKSDDYFLAFKFQNLQCFKNQTLPPGFGSTSLTGSAFLARAAARGLDSRSALPWGFSICLSSRKFLQNFQRPVLSGFFKYVKGHLWQAFPNHRIWNTSQSLQFLISFRASFYLSTTSLHLRQNWSLKESRIQSHIPNPCNTA